MRPTRPRLTVRRLMALVIVVAIAFALESRAQRFRIRAQHHQVSSMFVDLSWTPDTNSIPLPPLIRHHEAMAAKYEHAARYPWLPVEPDPPEPK